jgi:folate-binding protein YgfZ
MIDEALQREYEAATAGAAVVRLRGWSTVRAAGKDRATFLHNMCTNDVKRLAVGEGCEAFFTDVKGKVVAHGFLLAGADAIEIVMVPGTADRLMAQLDRYIIREDVTLSDKSREAAWTLLVGARAGETLARVVGTEVGELAGAWVHRQLFLDGTAVTAVRCELPWMGGFLIGAAPDAIAAVEAKLTAGGAALGGDSLWNIVRVESNWPLWGIDFDESNLPQEVLPQEVSRDDQAISFRKGCYLGQETVARIDALGHVNKQLAAIRFEGNAVPEVGAELFQGEQPVGQVTSSCWSPRAAKPQAMSMVKRGANAAGTPLRWSGGEGTVLSS